MKFKLYFLAILCLAMHTQAQDKSTNITVLKIGDQVPDIAINNIINYKDKNGKPTTTAKISDFKGKLLILDFWATWCSPCIAMIPKMDSLQKQFDGKIQFIPIAYQSENIVVPFLEKFQKQTKKQYDLPDVTSDMELAKLFPHTYLPHYVWIDGNGIVKAITGYTDVNENNIMSSLIGEEIKATTKIDVKIPFDKTKPMLIANNGGDGKNLIYHSLLTSYTNGIGAGYNFELYHPDSIKNLRISARNQSIIRLFQLAYGQGLRFFNDNTVLIEAKGDTDLVFKEKSGPEYEDWYTRHSYCYELIVPHSMGKQAFDIMQQDLRLFLSLYSVKIERRQVLCLALVRTSNKSKFESVNPPQAHFDRFGCTIFHYPITAFIQELDLYYMQNSSIPIVDATGYKGLVDLKLDCSLSNLESVNKALSKYDLQFVQKKQKVDILVIKDNVNK